MPEHFFIAGAQRSGTTYLYHILDEHPEIEMARPIAPEPKFFITEDLYREGLEYYERHFFAGKPGARLRGEKSVSYMEYEKAARRIADSFPDARILFLLRDPVERAVSNYWYSRNNGLETLPIAEAFRREEERWPDYDHARISASPYAYLRRGRYLVYISVYLRYFPAENVKVLLHEELVGSTEHIRELYAFLGVSRDFHPPSIGDVINRAEKSSALLPPELKRYLHEYFAAPNARLAKALGLDLGAWQGP